MARGTKITAKSKRDIKTAKGNEIDKNNLHQTTSSVGNKCKQKKGRSNEVENQGQRKRKLNDGNNDKGTSN